MVGWSFEGEAIKPTRCERQAVNASIETAMSGNAASIPVGYPVDDAKVPDIKRKPLDEIMEVI